MVGITKTSKMWCDEQAYPGDDWAGSRIVTADGVIYMKSDKQGDDTVVHKLQKRDNDTVLVQIE